MRLVAGGGAIGGIAGIGRLGAPEHGSWRRLDEEREGSQGRLTGGLRDDSFAIRCDVRVFGEFRAKDDEIPEDTAPTFVSVTPSDLHQRLGDLLRTEKGADVVFNVGGQTFAAHRCVLAARSPVFSAELYGTMKERDTGCVVRIDDMESEMFNTIIKSVYSGGTIF
ncbi:hypothetical protein PR202_ga00304 [Eleusine coracana subsp. coracana]|uniref:BTB domain-containing protein n=1 Tax=Eleusine coracana subsp. coracana TaxID=191504 RepID=A0AAV5BFU8_ELECO|nr:hypothetical protein PR202_ga00304 [Eleusine coracana subsp. coracana]